MGGGEVGNFQLAQFFFFAHCLCSNREVSVPRGLTVQLIETYECAMFLNALYIKPNRRKMNEMYKQRKRLNDNRCNNNNNNNNNDNNNKRIINTLLLYCD